MYLVGVLEWRVVPSGGRVDLWAWDAGQRTTRAETGDAVNPERFDRYAQLLVAYENLARVQTREHQALELIAQDEDGAGRFARSVLDEVQLMSRVAA